MAERRYRIRIFNAQGSCVEGGFATLEEAAARQDVLREIYAASDENQLTVLETYTPTRPVYERVQQLLALVKAQVGETDPILRLVQGANMSEPLLVIYDSLCESVQDLAHIVYDEEGKF